MEARFSHDFGAVRVHADSASARFAEAIGARAFTVGRDIVIGRGQPQAGTVHGDALLAHELAHVIQQSGGAGAGASESALEADADGAARAAMAGHAVSVRGRAQPDSVQRAAPVAGAALSAFAVRCIVGAVVGAVVDLLIQYGQHSWRRGEPPWEQGTRESFEPNLCATLLAAALGCLGGMASLRWLEPFLQRAFPALSGGTATILGRLLLWIMTKAGVGIPRAIVRSLAMFGCVSDDEAEALAPGITDELRAEGGRQEPPADSQTEATP